MREKYKRLLSEKKVSTKEVSRQTGIPYNTLNDWRKGSTKDISADNVKLLANYFEVPVAYFYYDISDEDLSNHPVDYWNKYWPVYDVAAGNGRVNREYPDEFLKEECGEEYSFAQVHGDSMSPELRDGDIVKVHHQYETDPSDFTVVKIDGETSTVKYVEIVDNGVWLRAENKEVFEDRFYTVQEVMSLPVTIIGKAVEVRRPL